MAELVITHANGTVSHHLLAGNALVVGRDAACDLPLDDPSSSRRHARIAPTPYGFVVEDLESKNGTLVNEVPTKSRLLKHGDQVLIGSTLLVFRETATTSATAVRIADDPATSHTTRYATRDKELNLSRQRLKMIYELGERLTTLQGQDQLLEDGMNICFEMLHFERGAIGVRRVNQRAVDWPVVRNLQGPRGELTISRTLLSRALEHGERAMFVEGEGGAADPTVSMVQHGIRSALCVPLIHREQVLGIIYGDRVRSSVSYTNEDIDFLAGIAQQLAIGLINCRLLDEQKRMIRLSHDIDMARTIQTGLLPAALPNRPGLRIAAVNDPGQSVSGDYYDVIEARDGRVWCLIADVTGKGMAAALLMANLQAAVRVTIHESDDPAALLSRWNRLIFHNTDAAKFITCLLMLLDPRAHEIRCATAGHFPPLVLRPGQSAPEELVLDPGLPLGAAAEAEYACTARQLGPPPYLALGYTDGIVEAMNPQNEWFGSERLRALLHGDAPLNAQALVRQIRREVADFAAGAPQSDDITLLAAAVD
ncbi:MAG: SpoIIE family protein phosphatase [Planctomycetes bacterium]|nr:SpoIIE family protein phosphatase [Planctomycetota bacterium]